MIKIIMIVLIVLTFTLSFTAAWAQKPAMDKAYSLYFQGRMQEAVKIMQTEAEKNPDPQTYYFIGYAYYKMRKTDLAKEYFDKAYQMKPFFAPVIKEKKQ